MSDLRTGRTFGVTAELKPIQRMHLTHFRQSEVYPDVLDVLEMVCIELETNLINTDAAEESAVLANHKIAKAAWQIFVHMQEKIDQESKLFVAASTPKPPIPELTPYERFVEHLLDPTKPTPEPEDYFGM